MRPLALSLLALLVGLWVAWALSQRALQAYWQIQASAIAAAHDAGHSVLQFPLRSPGELVGGQPQQVLDYRFDSEGLWLQLDAGPANLPLGFSGRCLRSDLFPLFSFTHHNTEPLRLALVQAAIAGGEQRLAEIGLPAGTGRRQVDLRSLDWRGGTASGPPRPLGDARGRICEFRLVPVATGPAELRLADLRFVQAAGAATPRPAPLDVNFSWQGPAALLSQGRGLQAHADQPLRPIANWPALLGPLADDLALGLAILSLCAAWSKRTRRSSVLLALVSVLLLLVEIRPLQAGMAAAAVTASLLTLTVAGVDRRAAAGSWVGTPRAWSSLLPGLLLVLALAAVAGQLWGTGQRHWPALDDCLRYLLWAALQQALLQRVFVPVLAGPIEPARSWTAAASLLPAAAAFALLHLPNLELALLCLLAGLWWSLHFQRHRAWLPLVLAHALLGSLLPELLPEAWLSSAEVGLRFLAAP